MVSWLKPELLVTIFFSALTLAGAVGSTAYVALRDNSTHTAVGDDRMASLQASVRDTQGDVKAIRDILASVPLYAQRLAQLEEGRRDQLSYNGAVDSRLSAIQGDVRSLTTDVDNLKRASGIRLRN